MAELHFTSAPDRDEMYAVGDNVEVYCDHERGDVRVRDWLEGVVVQVDPKMIAIQFRSNVYLTDGWMVPDHVLSRGVFAGDDKVADYMASIAQAGLDGGTALGTWGQLRFGPVWTRVNARTETGSPELPTGRETTAGLRAGLFVDQIDHAFFPTHGFGATAAAYAAMTSFGSALSYQRVEGAARLVRSWGPHTLNLSLSGGTDFGSDMPAYESFTLGGPLRLSGYRANQFAGREYAFGRMMYYYQWVPLPEILGSGIYLGGSLEVGRMTDRFDGLPSAGTLWSGSVFLGADTFAGPAYFGFGLGQSGNWGLYLLLGAP